jgi:hypothetical protein
VSPRVAEVRAEVERALSVLALNWTPDTTFTFIARNPNHSDREMIVTSDPDLEAVAALLASHQTSTSKGA